MDGYRILQLTSQKLWIHWFLDFDALPVGQQVRQHLGRLPAINPATRTLILTGAALTDVWVVNVEKALEKTP